MNSTKKYIIDNKYVFSLKDRSVFFKPRKKKVLVGWSFIELLKYHIRILCICIIRFPIAIYEGRYFIISTWGLRNSKKKKRLLIVGNGPSQGYLKKNDLKRFLKSGGEIICINYWNQNKILSSCAPTWLCLSDPLHFSKKDSRQINLIKYLKNNPSIKIIIPTSQIKNFKAFNLVNKFYCFIDVELSISKNISPIFPRGYLSLTLYKALAWASYLNYNLIGIIGMDNTYIRNLYCNNKNEIKLKEEHAGIKPFLTNYSIYYSNVASAIDELVRHFYHLEYFPTQNIVNLDPYSLSDRFKKVDKKNFFKIKNKVIKKN
jgi:hypothetical protein